MMAPLARAAQVREGNFLYEIPDGISYGALVRYRTGCQGRCGVLRLRSDAQNETHPVSLRTS